MTYTLALFVSFGAFIFVSQYLQMVLGLSPLEAGLWTLPWSLGFILGSLVTPALARGVRPAPLMAAGLVLAAAGFAVLMRVGVSSGVGAVVAASVMFSIGLSPSITLVTDMVLGTAPPERAGSASALSETSAELGGALGIAVLGSIGTAVYRGAMAGAVPAGVPPGAAQAARGTLGGAVAAAAGLASPHREELLAAAREAFTHGFQKASAVSAVIAAGLAVVVVVLLRDGPERFEVRNETPPKNGAAAR